MTHDIEQVVGKNRITYYRAIGDDGWVGPTRRDETRAILDGEYRKLKADEKSNKEEMKRAILERAHGRCELCRCPEGNVIAYPKASMWAEELPERTMNGTPFRRWRSRCGPAVPPPTDDHTYRTTIELRVVEDRCLCQRCISALRRGMIR
jgi:hypothetical protein